MTQHLYFLTYFQIQADVFSSPLRVALLAVWFILPLIQPLNCFVNNSSAIKFHLARFLKPFGFSFLLFGARKRMF